MRLLQLVRKEFIQLRRDVLLAFFLLLVPVAEFFLMSRSTGREVKNLEAAVLDWDHTVASRRMVELMDETRRLQITDHVADDSELYRQIEEGRAVLGVIIPAGFESELRSPDGSPRIYAIVDGSRVVPASMALGGLSSALEAFTRWWLKSLGWNLRGTATVQARYLFNPTGNIRYFMLPAMVGFIVYQLTLAIASLGLARERELGTLEQLVVSPLPRLELIVGKAIPPFIAGMVNFVILLTVAREVYHVPMRGSLPLLSFITAVFLTSEVGWGLMLSTFSRTQQQAILFVFIQVMVDAAFSGFLVPVENMPRFLQVIATFVPLQHYLAVIRPVMLKGATLADLWQRVAMLSVLSLAMFTFAVVNTSRRLD